MAGDVLVMGGGPAGLALAGEAAARGLAVTCVDPSPDATWDRSFGMWGVEADALGPRAPIEARWARPVVELGDQGRFSLDAAYCRIDVATLQRRLSAEARDRGVRVERGRAVGVEADARGARVRLDSGATMGAEIVVDASGGPAAWIHREPARPPAHQVAVGQLVDVDAHPYAPDEMALMDLRPIGQEPSSPTFLYALPLGPQRLFVEETSLVCRPAIPHARLESRLRARLASLGIVVRRVVSEERCTILMNAARPRADQPVLTFGAAAGMVHPATGYQLARALLEAPRVADALAGPGAPRARVRAAHEAIWPAARRRAWALYTFGMEALLRLDADTIRHFFASFFRLPASAWLPYLRGIASPSEIAWAMGRVALAARGRARRELVRLGPEQRRLLIHAFSGVRS